MRISPASAARRVSAVLTVSLALGLTVGCHRDPNKQKQRYLDSGKRYADQGKFKEATIQFANALKVDRNFAPDGEGTTVMREIATCRYFRRSKSRSATNRAA